MREAKLLQILRAEAPSFPPDNTTRPPNPQTTVIMVIGIIGLLTVTSIPTITGVGQAVSAQKRQNAASKEQEKFNLTATVRREKGGKEEEAVCYLKGGKVCQFQYKRNMRKINERVADMSLTSPGADCTSISGPRRRGP